MLYNEVRVSWTISGAHNSQVNDLAEEQIAACKCTMPYAWFTVLYVPKVKTTLIERTCERG